MRGRTVVAILGTTVLAIFIALAATPAYADQAPCESLAQLKLPDTTIMAATAVPAGDFTPLGAEGAARGPRPIQLPAFCRVQLTIAPSIRVEVWLPASGWNGNFEAVGGGGYAGVIVYAAMGNALKAGYATASTDTGHQGGTADFAMGHPELIVDYGYRAIHEMTLKSKQVIQAMYGAGPRLAFFNGCSTGGRQGLTEAQRYPDDYNGILAGAPAIEWSHLQVRNLYLGLETLKDEASYIPAAKLAAIQDATVGACDSLDGLKDGLVDDPRKCNFDPTVLLCKSGDSDNCLTAPQVDTLKVLYQPIKYPNGKIIYPAYMPGTEKGWNNFTTGAGPGKSGAINLGIGYMRFFVLSDPNWDYKSWDAAKDMALVDDSKIPSIVDSMNADLRPYRDRGGKLIMYQGWGDDAVSPIHTINYFKSVVSTTTGKKVGDAYTSESADSIKSIDKTGEFARLFMVPGMNHCGGGSGPNVFDGFGSLTAWVEMKTPPAQIVATHMTNGAPDRTRPLCPYPQTAQYSGHGSIDDAANFVCELPAGK